MRLSAFSFGNHGVRLAIEIAGFMGASRVTASPGLACQVTAKQRRRTEFHADLTVPLSSAVVPGRGDGLGGDS